MLIDLPFELLSDIVEGLVAEYLFDYFLAYGGRRPWNAISALSNVSVPLRAVVYTLLASSLAIPRLEDGRLSRHPFTVISLARNDADARFHEECCYDDSDSDTEPVTYDNNISQREAAAMWWRPSPLLVLYNVIRWTRLRKDQITREEFQLQRLAELPPLLVEPMQRAEMAEDQRLVQPALVEAAYLWAGMSFVGHLAGAARFFELLCMAIQKDPAWVNAWHDKIDVTLATVEHLELTCIEALHWVCIANPKFVQASHIHDSRIVPALCKFLNMTVNSDPNCERWRLSVEVLLRAWRPLDLEVVNQAYEGVSMIFSESGF